MKLFLDVFIFQLQKKEKGKYTDEVVNFSEVHKQLNIKYPEKGTMMALLQDIINSIDTTFYINGDNSKALSFCKSNTFAISENTNCISGRFVGGNTGLQFDVYNNDDATQPTHIIKPDEVASVQFFFKIWLPKDFSTGVLIVQRYSNNTCLGLLKERLYKYFQSIGYKFISHKFVPEDRRREFLEACNITRIGISWKKGIDNTLKPQVDLLRNNNITHIISNISLSTKKLLTDNIYRRTVSDEVSTLYPEFDSRLHDIKFYYIDTKGQKASSTLEEIECLLPSISLDESCINFNNTPNWEAIETTANSCLELIKADLKYTAKVQ